MMRGPPRSTKSRSSAASDVYKRQMVYIQLNETYYDRFGHTEERPIMIASLNNVTATEIGDWPAFKKYIGKDMERFKQVVEVSY